MEEGTHYRRKERRDRHYIRLSERRHHSGSLSVPPARPPPPLLRHSHHGICGGVTALLVGVLALGVLGQVGQATREPHEGTQERSFSIDYDNNQFLKDGEPFRYVSGSIHYFRTLPSEWRDRLKKMRMAGFNALETYVEWSSHEPEQGTYDFSGINDLPSFLTIAQEEDLVVILRLGPFADAERDMGGLPTGCSQEPRLRLGARPCECTRVRGQGGGCQCWWWWLVSVLVVGWCHAGGGGCVSAGAYLKYVDAWFGDALLPKVKPLLYENGGPVIMMQVANEYGSYPDCDFAYTSHLRDLVRAGVGEGTVLFTTDGNGVGFLKCGKIPEVYATVDFGSGTDVAKSFDTMRLFEPRGPLVNSEYYPGWLDHWGAPHSTVKAEAVAKTLDEMLALNASVNMYMFHGGTSFGFTAGSNMNGAFQACPTSYDYDAPLSEAGDPTDKYWIVRNVTAKYLPLPPGKVPPASPKHGYGKVSLAPLGSVFHMLETVQKVTSKWPLTFEALLVPNGLVVYQTVLPFRIADPARLTLNDLHDRGYVFVDAEFAGMVSREQDMYDLAISARPNQTLTIVVESQGRICFGPHINDFKGITANVSLSGHILENWTMAPLPLTNAKRLDRALTRLRRWAASMHLPPHRLQGTDKGGMTFFTGHFQIPTNSSHPMDTFLRLDGWSKGLAWVNNFCLGRYWPEVGPQVTLYVPRGVLQPGNNTLVLLEQEAAPCLTPDSCYVTLQDTHVIDGPTPL
ncbi:Beta-galactosidase [Chionoecetes opilio]|uniref:Beta-galactosidase n=1 Tax=Chionoecetes opilio TaxID=41210 RepID=A0A8J4YFA1_CHIOP|nr:Beta-galactosidase [Chionoecetes opilio]